MIENFLTKRPILIGLSFFMLLLLTTMVNAKDSALFYGSKESLGGASGDGGQLIVEIPPQTLIEILSNNWEMKAFILLSFGTIILSYIFGGLAAMQVVCIFWLFVIFFIMPVLWG